MPSGRQRLYDLVVGSILAVGRLVSSFSKVFCSRLREYGAVPSEVGIGRNLPLDH